MGMGSFAILVAALSFLLTVPCQAQLSTAFYDATCPDAVSTIRTSINGAVSSERRMAASIIRLIFHDCFVQGCDASILLDDSSTIQSEKSALPNLSVRGYNVIDDAKAAVEAVCPGVVSCADVLAVAARDSSVAVGGPTWEVKLGRRDSTTAYFAQAGTDLPGPGSTLSQLIDAFDRKGFNTRELVALSGSHTIGQSQCRAFRTRIYSNGTSGVGIDPEFATSLQGNCPETAGTGDGNLAPLDLVTPNTFDNNYFRNLVDLRGLLNSDQVLFNNGSADSIVVEYSNNAQTFSDDFASAMVKMSEMSTLTGSTGIIRTVCTAIN